MDVQADRDQAYSRRASAPQAQLNKPVGNTGVVEFNPPPDMSAHPFLDAFPMMTAEEFARLVWSIKRHGLYNPISVTSAGVILDGRCRLMACKFAGVEPRFKTVDPDDPLAFICSLNVQRVSLNSSQVALCDALFEDVYRDDPDCPVRVMPEARLVAQHRDLVEQVLDKWLPLRDAHETALERERELLVRAEQAERLAHLRAEAPYLAIQVDEGALTLAEAVEAHQEKVRAPLLTEHAEVIRAIGKRVTDDIIEIGRRLTECKQLFVERGGWLRRLEREFAWTDDTALNFMRAYQLSEDRNFRDLSLPVSGIYLLAKPSTPEAVRDEVFRRAESGEAFSVDDIKRAIDTARGRTPIKPLDRRQLCDLSARMKSARPDDPLAAELHRLLFGDAMPTTGSADASRS